MYLQLQVDMCGMCKMWLMCMCMCMSMLLYVYVYVYVNVYVCVCVCKCSCVMQCDVIVCHLCTSYQTKWFLNKKLPSLPALSLQCTFSPFKPLILRMLSATSRKPAKLESQLRPTGHPQVGIITTATGTSHSWMPLRPAMKAARSALSFHILWASFSLASGVWVM